MPDYQYPWNNLDLSATTTTTRISGIEEAIRRLSERINEINGQYINEQISSFPDIHDVEIGYRPEIPEWVVETADIHGDPISATAYSIYAEEAADRSRRKRKRKTPENEKDPPTLADDFIDACLR